MNKHLISLLFVVGICASNTVLADPELESNDTLATAQLLVMNDAITIEGELTSSDKDFFKFYGMPGDIVDVDIDQGIGGTANVNTYVAIFDQDGLILRANDDSPTIDTGSSSYSDSSIEAFVIPKEGYYTVGVTNYSTPFFDGGTVVRSRQTHETTGDYILNIDYTSKQVKQVALRLSPGNVHYRPINPLSRGSIKAAILSAADFNAPLMVVPSSLTFGATGTEKQAARCRAKDVNRDSYPDLVCKFSLRNAGLASFHDEVMLKGKTIDGSAIEGSGYIKMRKHHRGYDDEHRDRKDHGHSNRYKKHRDDHDDD